MTKIEVTAAVDPTVRFEDVSLRTSDGRTILNSVNLEIASGTTTALLGRSGSGKTTLLRMVNRLVEPTAGRVIVEGRAVSDWDPIALRRSIGYVIQDTGLFPHFTAERNMAVVPEISGMAPSEIDALVQYLFTMVDLDYSTFSHRYPHELSGGQRQRVGLARALAAEPKLLLMDEPFGALDPLTRAEMQDMLRELLARLKKTVLLVTHDLNEAIYLASRIILLDSGEIVANLPADKFLLSEIPPVQAYVRSVHRDIPGIGGR